MGSAEQGQAFVIERNGKQKACLVPMSVFFPDIAPARIADARREVADDQDDNVPRILKRPQLAEHHGVPEVDVWRRRIDAQFDAKRPTQRELAFELTGRKHLDRAFRQQLGVADGHRPQC